MIPQQQTESSFFLNGVQMGVREHFTQKEWEKISTLRWLSVSAMRKNSLDHIEKPTVIENLGPYHLRYVYLMAYFQRIQIPLKFILSRKVSAIRFPLLETPNFQVLSTLIDRFFKVIPEMDATEDRKKELTQALNLLALKLWMSGYGILPGITFKAIDEEVIETVKEIPNSIYNDIYRERVNPLRLFSKMLILDSNTLVKNPKLGKISKKEKSAYDLELSLWKNLLIKYSSNEVIDLLREYIFGELWDRVDGKNLIREYTHIETNQTICEGLKELKPRSWQGYSISYRLLAPYLANSTHNITDILQEHSFSRIFHQLREMKVFGDKTFKEYHWRARAWLDWLIKTKEIDIKLENIFPEKRHISGTTNHGKKLEPIAVSTVINHLLNLPTGFVRENNIREYRCRRACLIMLSTGGRASQTLTLKRDCLHKDKFNNTVLHFHNVKNNNPYSVYVDDGLQLWVKELQLISPKSKLKFDSNLRGFSADGLTEYRLFANDIDEGPLKPKAVLEWFQALQKHIWPTDHPNGELFTLHDLRRMQATYTVIRKYSKELIRLKLGQTNITSIIPYTATGDPGAAYDFASILEGDIWDLKLKKESNDVINLVDVLKISEELAPAKDVTEHWMELITKTSDATKDIEISTNSDGFMLTPIATGRPLLSHNCASPVTYNCGSAPINCMACRYYLPDGDKLEDHKAFILRQMVSCLHHESLEKHHKQTGYRKAVYLIVNGKNGLKETIHKAIMNTFINGFDFSKTQAKKEEEHLWKCAKRWYKANKKELKEPMLSHTEALEYLDRDIGLLICRIRNLSPSLISQRKRRKQALLPLSPSLPHRISQSDRHGDRIRL